MTLALYIVGIIPVIHKSKATIPFQIKWTKIPIAPKSPLTIVEPRLLLTLIPTAPKRITIPASIITHGIRALIVAMEELPNRGKNSSVIKL